MTSAVNIFQMSILSSNEDVFKDKVTDTYAITNDPIEFRIKSADISVQWISPSDIIFSEGEESRCDVEKKWNLRLLRKGIAQNSYQVLEW